MLLFDRISSLITRNQNRRILFKNNSLLYLSFLLIGIVAAQIAVAEPYIPESTIHILTETGFIDSGKSQEIQDWTVESRKENGEVSFIRFLPKGHNPNDFLCEIEFKTKKNGKTLTWREKNTNRVRFGEGGLLIIPGYPAPCDVIPIENVSNEDIYTIKSEAGGRTFIKNYRTKLEMIPIKTALENDWLRIDKGENSKLRMVIVEDERGRTILRQLWPIGDSWWVFEETKNRRSWRTQ